MNMELLGRLFTALGISLVITLLLLVLYQDDPQAQMPEPATTAISQQTSVATAAVDTP